MKKKKKYLNFWIAIFIVVLLVLIILIATGSLKISLKEMIGEEEQQGRVIEENLVIPVTEQISGNEGRISNTDSGAYNVPLVPKNNEEKIIVPNAVYTLKNAYDAANQTAIIWSSDSKLVLIKSLGTIALDGKSSEWQLVFNSVGNKKDYEIIIMGDSIASKKELDSNTAAFDLPVNWYDSEGAIKSIQTLPQFSDATISSISFYYNTDGKNWEYALNTSKGMTSMPVK